MEGKNRTFKVELDGQNHVVRGLKDEFTGSDTMLLLCYEAGDCDTRMTNAKMMHNALYDLYQCHDDLKSGDRFETEFGNFVCEGAHVEAELRSL